MDNKNLKLKAEQIQDLILNHMKIATRSLHYRSSTSLPYYDLTDNYTNTVRTTRTLGEGDKQLMASRKNSTIPDALNSGSTAVSDCDDIFLPEMNEKSRILDKNMFRQIVAQLPSVLKFKDWKLEYSNFAHGNSIETFYRNMDNCGPNVLIIKDDQNHVFGGFASEAWKVSRYYYGNGESFLFTLHDNQTIQTFISTNENEYFMCSDKSFISMGADPNPGFSI